jgi:GNAT superfamily N-acetyltransferase
MNTDIHIRSIRQGEEEAIASLVKRSFDMFVGSEYSCEGVCEFFKYANPTAMTSRLTGDHFILVAELQDQAVGMIEIRKNEHVSLLFVDPSYLRKGISRLLFDHALREIGRANPLIEKITVNSSRYAVPVYESLGFVASGPENTINGITFVPMAFEIQRVGT